MDEEELPDGLYWKDGLVVYDCNSCDRAAEWHGAIDEFEYGDPLNMCGGSPRCCP